MTSKFFVCRSSKIAESLGGFQNFGAKAGEKFAVRMCVGAIGTASYFNARPRDADGLFLLVQFMIRLFFTLKIQLLPIILSAGYYAAGVGDQRTEKKQG